ncbi:MAG: GNAT family N-acetyltransferase [Eudoraea sp.]|uniref:GNAT family N-acetyltransferase n=1 Tax=Eudoraea sp. TaxID=1979955 RepID=UPI003263C719
MIVNNLSKISVNELIDCFLKAFEGYYVKMPSERNYYKERWKAAKVDLNFSYGMFDKGKLVGFIIHAIDKRFGILTAFNTGTGVLPEYRGKGIVNSIYEYALKDLWTEGVEKSTLEVIRKNEKAIRCYEKVGFIVSKKYKCYTGDIKVKCSDKLDLKEIALKDIDWGKLPNQQYYSWDFQKETLLEGNYTFVQVFNKGEIESFFIINRINGYLAQFDILNTENRGWNRLFSAIKEFSDKIKVINVDERLTDKLNYLILIGLKNSIDQFEMELEIKMKNNV